MKRYEMFLDLDVIRAALMFVPMANIQLPGLAITGKSVTQAANINFSAESNRTP